MDMGYSNHLFFLHFHLFFLAFWLELEMDFMAIYPMKLIGFNNVFFCLTQFSTNVSGFDLLLQSGDFFILSYLLD